MNYWRSARYFLVPVLIFLIAGILFLVPFTKDEIHLFLNQYHGIVWDRFFSYSTWLGDGLIYIPLILYFAFRSWRWTMAAALNGILVLLLVSLGKQVLFTDHQRPMGHFAEKVELYLVEGVEVHENNSFPSGHTTTAFAVFGLLAFYFRRKDIQFTCFLLALVAGASRIYLSQHFLEDVLAGAFLGSVIALGSYWFLQQFSAEWSQKNLLSVFNRS